MSNMKHRPSTFAMQARLDTKASRGELRVAVNARALCARAFASLPPRVHARLREGAATRLEWRVVPGEATFQRERAPDRPFALTSNRGDAMADQPASFVASQSRLRVTEVATVGTTMKTKTEQQKHAPHHVTQRSLPAFCFTW